MKIHELIAEVDGAILTGNAESEIENLEYDSRQIRPGSLFVAVKGFKEDGYSYVEQAIANGAIAVMGERESAPGASTHIQVPDVRKALADVAARFYGYPGMHLKACGVTGTNGKTTTCNLIKKILEARGKKVGLITSLVYDTGEEQFVAYRTTPESLDMQRLLFLMRKNDCVNAVIETSSHALVLHRVDHINYRVAVYTNLTRDHLDFHGTMEDYYLAKAMLVSKLQGPLSYAVINLDVPEFHQLFGELSGPFIAYALNNKEADVYAGDYDIKPDKTIFDLVTPMGTRTVSFWLPGQFNLMNALAAAAGGLACGCDLDTVVKGREEARPIPGRFNYVEKSQPFAVYVDYAHTPDAIERLCEASRGVMQRGRILLLFGCGGDRDKGKRPLMGTAATSFADYVVVTSDNPRSEDPLEIIEEIKPGLKGHNFEIHADRREAIKAILAKARPGDVVLLAGKGAERYQEIKGVKHDFDDITEAKRALEELGHKGEPAARGTLISLRFDHLARMTGGTLQTAAIGDRTFTGVSIDSRTLQAGELFIALRGERVDGHTYLTQAVERGAAGLMTESNFTVPTLTREVAVVAVKDSHEAMMSLARQYREMITAKIVGITGSNGKTTTKEMTFTLLSAVDKDVYRSSGNLNNLYGMPLAIFAMPKATHVAVMEMGISKPGEMTRLTQIVKPDLALITNIGATHLEFLGSLEGVARAKLEMVASSSPDTPVIINADDPVLTKEIKLYRENYITFGITHAATFEAEKVQRQSDGTAIVTIEGHRFRLPLFGEHQVYNLLAGYAVARTLGYSFDGVDSESIPFATAPMRGQTVTQRGVTFIVDCYNANPESVRLGLRSLAGLQTSGRRIIILGDMLELGALAQEYHRQIGALLAQQPFDLMVGVGPLAISIVDAAADNGVSRGKLQHFGDATSAAVALRPMFKQGDLVYIKGSRGIGLERVYQAFVGEGEGN